MECQIVPTYKHVCVHNRKVKKQRRGDDIQQQQKQKQQQQQQQQQQQSRKKSNAVNETKAGEDEVFILQPMFKPPKSTKDVSANKEEDNAAYAVNAISESNKGTSRNGQFNHFTMSRKGVVKNTNTVSRVEDPFYSCSPQTTPENCFSSLKDNDYNNANGSPDNKSYAATSTSTRNSGHSPDRNRIRRASAGDVLVRNNNTELRHPIRSAHHARNQSQNADINQECSRVVSIGPDEVLLIPHFRRPSEPATSAKRRESCKAHLVPGGDNPPPIPRRKSFHDWYSIQEWYLPEPRPVSSDLEPNSRRNVISPCTLTRLLPSSDDKESTSISVCTEGDRMSYNFNLPNRRLVSHKDLKKYSLPYSDNIGLEEAVSSDQARKGSIKNSKQLIAIKKKYETDRQTPKQIWYRTVRSILAANHLYHSVQRKNNKNLKK